MGPVRKVSSASTRALQSIGDSTAILSQSSVGGGCISDAFKITTEVGCYFLKTHPHSFFHAEAFGLGLLLDTETLGVPRVLAVDSDYLLLEWIPSQGSIDSELLGRQLAKMHESTRPLFGLEHDNFIGANSQTNRQEDDWVTFFGQHRLEAQARIAIREGRWNSRRSKGLKHLIKRLGDILPSTPPSSLCHGDLWSGNVMSSTGGRPFLIDPAVYFGDRETDIAFSKLFGGFSATFYDAYREAWPLESGWNERFEIYNLYHLLNHLNLFGEGYGSAVDNVLNTYGS